MAATINKTEIKRLGKLYAERLTRNIKLRPEHMKELTRKSAWKEACQYNRDQWARDVRQHAASMLVEAGFSSATIATIKAG